MQDQSNETTYTLTQKIKTLKDKIDKLTSTVEQLTEIINSKVTKSKIYHSDGKFTGDITFKNVPSIESDNFITSTNFPRYISSGLPFTLQVNNVLQGQEPIIGYDTINSRSGQANVRVIEQYYPAFFSFKVGFSEITSSGFGFVFTDAPNTFVFGFQLSDVIHFTENGFTSGDNTAYYEGDVLTMVLNNSYCYFYQNGILIRQTPNTQVTDRSYNVQFYFGEGNKEITNIRYGV